MTKDELKKEAEEKAGIYFDNLDYDHGNVSDTPFSGYDVYIAYKKGALDFAEPREKRIAELKAQIEKMKNWCNCKNYQKCLIELAEQGKGMKPSECCVNCKNWELEDYRTRLERRNNKKQEIKENE